MHAHHRERDGPVIDDADNHDAHVAASGPPRVDAEPEVAEQEGVQGGRIAADQVIDQAFDLSGRRTDFTGFRSARGVAKTEQNVLHFTVGDVGLFLEQAVKQGHRAAQVEHGFLQLLQSLLSAEHRFQGLPEAVVVQVSAGLGHVEFGPGQRVDLLVQHGVHGQIEVTAGRGDGGAVLFLFEVNVVEVLVIEFNVVDLMIIHVVHVMLHWHVVEDRILVLQLKGSVFDVDLVLFRHPRPPPARPSPRCRSTPGPLGWLHPEGRPSRDRLRPDLREDGPDRPGHARCAPKPSRCR